MLHEASKHQGVDQKPLFFKRRAIYSLDFFFFFFFGGFFFLGGGHHTVCIWVCYNLKIVIAFTSSTVAFKLKSDD